MIDPMNFDEAVLPHLDAAYNLARWLTRNDSDAQDVVQEAYLRAFRFFGGFRDLDARAWLLTIVRNTCYTWLRRNRSPEYSGDFEEAMKDKESQEPDPETAQVLKARQQLINEAIEELPIEFREVIVLRELEELSYKEIAAVAGIPIGTVMSRLARGRKRLQESLSDEHDSFIKKRKRRVYEERSCTENSEDQFAGADYSDGSEQGDESAIITIPADGERSIRFHNREQETAGWQVFDPPRTNEHGRSGNAD